MSILKLANGQQFTIKQPNERDGILEDRNRPIVEFVFIGEQAHLDKVQKALMKPENIESLVVYYHGDDPGLSSDAMEGVACKELEAYTVPGPITRERIVLEKGTPTNPTEYGWQLKVEIGQRLYGEE